MKLNKLGSFLLLFMVSTFTYAASFTVSCPDQTYEVAGSQSGYYYINGYAVVDAGLQTHFGIHGRFLNPGKPQDLDLRTISIWTDTYDDNQGISFNCMLANEAGERVAFVTKSMLIKDIGLSGHIAACSPAKNQATCEVLQD